MILKHTIIVLLIPFLCLGQAQELSNKCVITVPVDGEDIKEDFFVYTGDDFKLPDLKKVFLRNVSDKQQWIKQKGTEEDQLSLDYLPQDSLGVYIISDTSTIKQFETITAYDYEIENASSQMKEIEVVCDHDRNVEFYKSIEQALLNNKYEIDKAGVDGVLGSASNEALKSYQRDNNLTVGYFDIETIQKLVVEEDPNKCYIDHNVCHLDPYATYETEKVWVETPAGTRWEKRKSDKNCLSSDPNDCLVWCLVDVPAVARFEEKKTFIYNEKLNRRIEVLCDDDLTEELVVSIYEHLYEYHYIEKLKKRKRKKFENIKKAFEDYQKAHSLHVGHVSIETLQFMGLY